MEKTIFLVFNLNICKYSIYLVQKHKTQVVLLADHNLIRYRRLFEILVFRKYITPLLGNAKI